MSVAEILDAGSQIGGSPKRHTPQWIERVDALLDVHRNHFLRNEPTVAELQLHKAALELAIETGDFIIALIDNPEVSLRLQLLADAYTLFHDPNFSERDAERLLKEVFPE